VQRTAAVFGVVALSFPGAALVAQPRGAPPAQRGSPPGQDTPYILVTAFHASDKKLAVEGADELRDRLKQEHSAKELFVLTKTSVEGTLTASGYPVDSALSTSDLMELAKSMRGEYTTDAWIRKTGTGNAVRVNARLLYRQGQQTLAQPLPVVDAKDPGDAAKQLDKAIVEALKQVPMFKECTNSWRAQKFDEAATKARAGIAVYPNAAWSRVCLLLAYASSKGVPPDSVISVATNVLATDSTSVTALANLADAYSAKADTIKMVETMLRMYRLDPSNRKIIDQIIPILAIAAPDKGTQIIDDLLKDNPGDLELTETKWKLQRRAGRFKDAMATNDELVKLDAARATADWYNRQIGLAQSDSNSAKIIEYAAKAADKFPKDISFPTILSQTHYRAKQFDKAIEASMRATAIDPKDSRAWIFAMAAAKDMNRPDSVLAIGLRALAAGADKAQVGQMILSPAKTAFEKAQASKTRDDWKESLKMAELVDSIAPTPESKFFAGVSAYQVAGDILKELEPLTKNTKAKPAERATMCTLSKDADQNLTKTSMMLPQGGRVSPEFAQSVLGNLAALNEYVTSVKGAMCAPPPKP
jgi:tetratricopeptide (TPR) repeat protein